MKRQSVLENFFKSKGSSSSQIKVEPMRDTPRKRRLSIKRASTPSKCPREGNENANISDVVDLCDDDILWQTELTPLVDLTQVSSSTEEVGSACSSQTILYELSPEDVLEPHIECTPERAHRSLSPVNDLSAGKAAEYLSESFPSNGDPVKELKTPQKKLSLRLSNTPNKTQGTSVNNPVAKQATEATSLSNSQENSVNRLEAHKTEVQGSVLHTKSQANQDGDHPSFSNLHTSPGGKKYYSPSKKRKRMHTATPAKVHRVLNSDLEDAHLMQHVKNEQFTNACQGMDDKTIFLLTIISKYLQDTTLHHLLDAEALTLLNQSLNVLRPGMRLVCRLYWRKEGWYKREQCENILTMDGKEPLDDDKFDQTMASLIDSGLVEKGTTENMSLEEYTSMLSRNELLQVTKELNLKTASKQDAIEALNRFSRKTINISHFFTGGHTSNSLRVLQLLNAKAGPSYKLADNARGLFDRLYQIMYLGLSHSIIQDKKLELVLLYDKIGRETYPMDKNMPLDNASVVFKTKNELERYMSAQSLYDDYLVETLLPKKVEYIKQAYEGYKESNIDETRAKPEWLRRYTAGNLYVKIMEAGIQDLKRDQRHLLALTILTSLIEQDVFRQHKKAEWYAEKALILHNVLSRTDEAGEVLLAAFKASDLREDSKDVLKPRARKIAAKVGAEQLKRELLEHAKEDVGLEQSLGGIHVHKQPMERTHNNRGKQKFKTITKDGVVVRDAEEYCIFHYICSGEFTHGQHWEGRIVTTIFHLLFWHIIYSKPSGVPGLFMCYYQMYPLDMYSPSFYTNRKESIDSWLDTIETSDMEKIIKIMQDTWNTRPECELSGINRTIGWANIRSVATLLGNRGLRAICHRLAVNYGQANSGFPDLTLWHEVTGKLKFVEVKTDADKPSYKQIQWMLYLREHGIATEFCYLGSNTTRQRCRQSSGRVENTQTTKSQRKKKPKTAVVATLATGQATQTTKSQRKRKTKTGVVATQATTSKSDTGRSQESQATTSVSITNGDDDLMDFDLSHSLTRQVKNEL